jgi:hypothetical protein
LVTTAQLSAYFIFSLYRYIVILQAGKNKPQTNQKNMKESRGGPYDTERTASLSDTISPKGIG